MNKLALILILLQTCNQSNQMVKSNYTLLYFGNGETVKVYDYVTDEIESNILKIFYNTDMIIRQIVSQDLINEIKNKNEGIEVVFENQITIESEKLGSFKIKKILIPFNGKYVGNKGTPSVIVFIANDKGYITGPLRCNNCLQYIDGVKKALTLI